MVSLFDMLGVRIPQKVSLDYGRCETEEDEEQITPEEKPGQNEHDHDHFLSECAHLLVVEN